MATFSAYNAVRNHLAANWTATPICWPNEDFTPPDQGAWVAVEMEGGLYEQRSIGAENQASNRWVEEGTLQLHVLVPFGTGELQASLYLEQLSTLLRGLELPGSTIFESMHLGVGVGDDTGKWWRKTLRAHYERG